MLEKKTQAVKESDFLKKLPLSSIDITELLFSGTVAAYDIPLGKYFLIMLLL